MLEIYTFLNDKREYSEYSDKELADKVLDLCVLFKEEALVNIDSEKYSNSLKKYDVICSSFYHSMLNLDNIEGCYVSSVLMGSILEAFLQLFLLYYSKDYNNNIWKLSDNIDELNALKKDISSLIGKHCSEGNITKEQKESLKKDISEQINIRTKGVRIDKIMLNDLISYFKSNDILLDNKKENSIYDSMIKIRDGRNNIHMTSNGTVKDREFVRELSITLIKIFDDLLFRVKCQNEDMGFTKEK